jgi:hypothetical protein
MATDGNYKGRPKLKKSKLKATDIASIEETFFVNGTEFSKGDDPESCPPATNWDFLSRRGSVKLKKESK